MNVPAPEKYFSGKQLMLAQSIYDADETSIASMSTNVDLNKPSVENMTLLFYALQAASGRESIRLKIITDLVKAGADPLKEVPDIGTVAGYAAQSDSPVFLRAMVDGGMSLDSKSGNRPLILNAATDHSINVLKYMVSSGADVNQTNSLGITAIIESLSGMDYESVSYLLNHGANPSLVTVNGWGFGNMLQKSIMKNKDKNISVKLEEIRKLAISKGMKWPPTSY